MFKIYCCFIFSSCLLFPFNSPCQSSNDSIFYSNTIKNIKSTYYSAIGEKTHLYNGIEYEYFGRQSLGNPFFLVDTMHKGSVFYDGTLYEDVPLRYDLVNDILLVRYEKDNNTIQLIKSKVDYFSLLNHKFIQFNDNDQSSVNFSGFYELLYNDKNVTALAKRFKKLQLSSNPEEKYGAFIQYDQYFIFKDETYFSVNSESDFEDVFRDKAQAIRKFIRTEKIKFKKNPEQAIISTATFYNRSTN